MTYCTCCKISRINISFYTHQTERRLHVYRCVPIVLYCLWDIVFISVREYHRGLTEWTRYNYYATLINHEGSIYIYKTCRKRMLSQCQMSAENVNMMCLLTDAGIRNLIGIFEEGTVISRKQLFFLSGWVFGKQFNPPPIFPDEKHFFQYKWEWK